MGAIDHGSGSPSCSAMSNSLIVKVICIVPGPDTVSQQLANKSKKAGVEDNFFVVEIFSLTQVEACDSLH